MQLRNCTIQLAERSLLQRLDLSGSYPANRYLYIISNHLLAITRQMRYRLTALLYLSTLPILVNGSPMQSDSTDTEKRFNYSATLQGIVSTGASPFWLRANQFGAIPLEGNVFLPEVSLGADYVSSRRWDWGFNLNAIGNVGKETALVIPEAHIKARFGKLEFFAGRKREIIGLLGDTTLTSGSFAESGNSLPLPRFQFGFIDYVPIFGGVFAFRGNFAHAFFDANPITKHHYLHQKTFYGRLGKPTWKVRLYAGFNHNVQWGGTIVTRNRWQSPNQTTYPSQWIDFWRIMSGTKIPNFGVDDEIYDANDRGNRLGNHLGSIDLGMEIRGKEWDLFFYRQNPYEDGSLAQMVNLADGLNGVSWKNRKARAPGSFYLRGVTAEFLYLISQGGDTFSRTGGVRGRDNYYNHIQYWGWVYQNQSIGTPFVAPKSDLRSDLPQTSLYMYTNNNRIAVAHLGVEGYWDKLRFLIKLSLSENKGTYEAGFRDSPIQFSGLARLDFPISTGSLGVFDVFAALGNDSGGIYYNTTGLQLGVRKRGRF